ncbi:MMPL family transporter [Streptomyces halobius]|uniref:MMPL family transporter n=1 Tax=Streptomyces halobius TaxID=2879846 RepID=A0ABY4LYQ7_9ACTN|nr:MMPL family transporter [Streptomyces halobius]UQA90639.1 MMPL family transporter [Streptomyces halobius]
MFAALGRAAARHKWGYLLVPLLLAGLALTAAAGIGDRLSYGGLIAADAESNRAAVTVRDQIGQGGADTVVIYRHPRHTVDEPAFRRGVEQSLSAVPDETVVSTMTYWSRKLPVLVSRDRHATAVAVLLTGSDDTQRVDSFHRLRATLRADGFQIQYAGPVALLDETAQRSLADVRRAELIAFPVVFLLLLLIFRTLVAALLPVVIGGLSIGITLGFLGLLRGAVEISFITVSLVTALGLALGVDAALFVVGRFREELTRKDSVPDAVTATCATAGRTVFLSGLTMSGIAAGFLFFPLGLVRSVGLGATAVIAVSAMLSITALPAALAVLGHRVNAGRLPWPRRRTNAPAGDGWAKLARTVMARPGHYLGGVLMVLLVLTAPFWHITVSFPDQRTLPVDASARVATDSLRTDFALSGLEATQVVVTVPGRLDTPAGQEVLTAWAKKLVRSPGANAGFIAATSRHSAVVYVAHAGNAGDPAMRDLVRHIRAMPPPPGGEVLVGGLPAMAVDTLDLLYDRLPWVLLYITVFTYLVLLVALRSVVLPAKALVVNALSLGASFGALVWIFQDGHLLWLVGGTRTGYIDVAQPVVMLLMLIALSMDYEFFLLSRIREQYDLSRDNTAAVALGLQRSGPVITAAALVVLVVSAIFAGSGVMTVKQLCVGMFIAIAVDATLIRALLVPAVMRLLGQANWWLPGAGGTTSSGTKHTAELTGHRL